jgi:predicted dehydrogenase
LASVMISTVARHGAPQDTMICGSEGTIMLNNDTERLLYAPAGEPLREVDVANPYEKLEGINGGIWNRSVVGALTELCGAINEHRALREGATFLDGLRNQRVLDAIRESDRRRHWVDVTS